MTVVQRLELPPVEVLAGSGLALLVDLAVAAPQPEIGDPTGETWLNLFGVALDAGPPYSVDRLLEAMRTIDPLLFREHLLGRFAWSWCALAGRGTIESAAAGAPDAIAVLLDHDRYYAGRAGEALRSVLPLSPAETRRRFQDAAQSAAMHPAATEALEREARAMALTDPLDRLEAVTGYRYHPEPEAAQVVLVPHLAPRPWLVLAQHRGARVIAYPGATAPPPADKVVAWGQALGDPTRVEILHNLGRGIESVAALVFATGLTRSTVHHHLGQLRAAGLVRVEGNARAYRYLVRSEAVTEMAEGLAALVNLPGGGA